MSQLSKKKSNIIFTIFIILLILSSICITYFLIIKHNSNKSFNTKNIFKFQSVSRKDTIDVFRKYPINPIVITNNETEFSISGLKNKEIENNINERLKEMKNNTKYCYVSFNVSNVFSAYCENNSISIDLNTGNDIILEEVFQKNSDINSILMTSFYQNICNFNAYCFIPDDEARNWLNDYDNNIENKLVEAFKKIYKNNYSFAIGYEGLHLFLDDFNWTNIYYYNSPNEITIYDRFLNNNNIYENKVSDYCEVQSCNSLTDLYNRNNEDVFLKYYYLNDKTYINFNIFNYTNYDIINRNNIFNKVKYDINAIGEKVLNSIIDKYINKKDNYNVININTTIYGISNIPYNIVLINIENKEFKKEGFIKYNLKYNEEKTISNSESHYSNMIIKNNEISYLDNNPRDIFNDFDETLYKHIKENLKGETDYDSLYFSLCCGSQFSEGYEKTDFKKIIKEASYTVDENNKLLFMNYSYDTISIPWDIFELKSTDTE